MSDAPEHIRPEQLFALIWARRDQPPAEEGPVADPELARLFRDLNERYGEPLAPELRLGPETVARWWAHAAECADCRTLILEDGSDARPPKTQAEVAAETRRAEDVRQAEVRRFWVDLTVGTASFFGAYVCLYKLRVKQAEAREEVGDGVLQRDPSDMAKQVDPLWYGFMGGILVAAWFLAEAYTIARKLWIDFTAWKRAVPIIGKRWAAKGKPPEDDD